MSFLQKSGDPQGSDPQSDHKNIVQLLQIALSIIEFCPDMGHLTISGLHVAGQATLLKNT